MVAARLLRSFTAMVLLAVPGQFVFPTSASGQLSDAFASHFGASRVREPTPLKSAGVGIMLLTQYGSRWKDPPIGTDTVTDYDQLGTTVGYNYLTAGVQKVLPISSPCTCSLVYGVAGMLGVTSDRLTRTGQDALHNFLRYPHVRRRAVANGDLIAGLDGDASLWRSFYWSSLTLDLFVNAGVTEATHHGEASGGLGVGVTAWLLRVQGSVHKAWWVNRSIVPGAVGNQLKSDYWMASGLVALDRTRYPVIGGVLPAAGVGVTWSSGLFPGEEELLMSVFLEFPGGSNDTWRFEFVNDALKDKDRGPTGGLRVVYVAR